MIRRLRRCAAGTAAVEFALVAPALFGFVFLILEGGRMAWTQQLLQETAFSAARCLGLRATGCTSATAMPAWAAAKARESGLVITADTVAATATATCDARAGMSRIVITSPYANAVGSILPASRASLTVTACFPSS